MGTDKPRVRVNAAATKMSGRTRTDLKDVNKDELCMKTPGQPKELINDTAKQMWDSTAKILIHRQQLKPAHFGLLLNYCNAYAVTVMTKEEMIEHHLVTATDDGGTRPSINSVYGTYFTAMTKAMTLLRIDPKTELMNSLAKAVQEGGSQYIEDKNKELYDQF